VAAKKKAKKSAKNPVKKSEATENKIPDVKEVRENIKALVRESANDIATGVITVAKGGLLANAKYLFEAAGVYPDPEEVLAKTEGEPLAQTLLRKMNLPTEPVVRDEEAEVVKLPKITEVKDGNEGGEKNSEGESSEREGEGNEAKVAE
jgi:hypothetical protein